MDNQLLKRHAKNLIDETKIVSILEPFGMVKFTGSYAHDLMALPDIDILVTCENPKEISYGKIIDLILKTDPFWMKLTDFTIAKPDPGFPAGTYLGLKYRRGELDWKIDIWFVGNSYKSELDDDWFSELTEEQRSEIVRRKNELIAQGLYPIDKNNPNSVSSVDLYKNVKNSRS